MQLDAALNIFREAGDAYVRHLRKWSRHDYKIVVDRAIFEEVVERSERYDMIKLQTFDRVAAPNCIKRGASYVYWTARLKPFSLLDRSAYLTIIEGIRAYGVSIPDEINNKIIDSVPGQTRSFLINEWIAANVGFSLANNERSECRNERDGLFTIDRSAKFNRLFEEFVTGLRYQTYSQAAIANILLGEARQVEPNT